jgi:TPR repeat protein
VTLLPPKPSAPFRSLLDPDFTEGKPERGCEFTNFIFTNTQPKPAKIVDVRLEVRYAAMPNANAVEETRKQVDTRTYDHPTDLPRFGDAAFWIGQPNNISVFVFLGGTTRLMIGPSEIGLEQSKALAAKALASLGKTSFTYGTPTGLTKPVPGKPGEPAALVQLKRVLTTKADAGDTKAQLALGRVYESGSLKPDGSLQHDFAGAAYWYQQASDHGNAEGSFQLAMLYHGGLGVTADPARYFHLLQKAGDAGYVPAMPLLSDACADQKTPVSRQRATDWARRAAEGGDSRGWLALGIEYNMGKLGGDKPYWYAKAMESYKKAADGGNCLAMIAIGQMYAAGTVVRADPAQAKSWQAKAQTCQDDNVTQIQQRLAQYKVRAAAARDPALYPVLEALPDAPNATAQAARNGSPGRGIDRSGTGLRIVEGLVVAAAIALAYDILHPDPNPPSGTQYENLDNYYRLMNQSRCSVASPRMDAIQNMMAGC